MQTFGTETPTLEHTAQKHRGHATEWHIEDIWRADCSNCERFHRVSTHSAMCFGCAQKLQNADIEAEPPRLKVHRHNVKCINPWFVSGNA